MDAVRDWTNTSVSFASKLLAFARKLLTNASKRARIRVGTVEN